MKNRRAMRGVLCGCVCAAISWGAAGVVWGEGNSGAGNFEEQYHRVLVAMKKPAATGILITEIQANSTSGDGGLWAGDILYNYASEEVHDLEKLRRLVSESFAAGQVDLENARAAGDTTAEMSKVLVGVHRGDKTLVLRLVRGPLGVRAIEVTANVPATPNPLASERGSLTPAWGQVIHSGEETTGFFRTEMGGVAMDWQKRTLRPVSENVVEGMAEKHDLDADLQWADTGLTTVTYRLRTGDFQKTPAFFLESVDVHQVETGYPRGNNTTTDIHVERAGLRTSGTKHVAIQTHKGSSEISTDMPANALPLVAVPIVAGALPHEERAALGLSLLSIEDFESRPGYVLVAMGKKAMGGAGGWDREGWRVDLIHCGMAIETCWFSDEGKLLQVTQYLSQPVVTRWVGSEEEATAQIGPPTTQQAVGAASQPGE